MKQIEEMKKYVKKNWNEMAKKTAMVCVAGGVWYVVYKLTGNKTKVVEVKAEVDSYKNLEVPESVSHYITEVWDSRKNHERVVVSTVVHLNELGDVAKAITDAYGDIDPGAPTVATIEIAV